MSPSNDALSPGESDHLPRVGNDLCRGGDAVSRHVADDLSGADDGLPSAEPDDVRELADSVPGWAEPYRVPIRSDDVSAVCHVLHKWYAN